MKKITIKFLFILVLLVTPINKLLSSNIEYQSLNLKTEQLNSDFMLTEKPQDNVLNNTTIIVKKNILLRDNYPQGITYKLGEVLDTLDVGEKLLIIEQKEVNTFLESYIWIKVQRLSVQERKPNIGWIYIGKEEAVKQQFKHKY